MAKRSILCQIYFTKLQNKDEVIFILLFIKRERNGVYLCNVHTYLPISKLDTVMWKYEN